MQILKKKRERYYKYFSEVNRLEEKITSLKEENLQKKEKSELYKYLLKELENLNFAVDEETNLHKQLNLLSNAKDIIQCCSELENSLIERDNSIYDELKILFTRIQNYEKDDKRIKDTSLSLEQALFNISDATAGARDIQNNIYVDEVALAKVDKRLSELSIIKEKYKMDLSSLELYKNRIKEYLSFTKNQSLDIVKLEKMKSSAFDKMVKLADSLSTKSVYLQKRQFGEGELY